MPPRSSEGDRQGVFVGHSSISVGVTTAAALLLRGGSAHGVLDLDPGCRGRLETLFSKVWYFY